MENRLETLNQTSSMHRVDYRPSPAIDQLFKSLLENYHQDQTGQYTLDASMLGLDLSQNWIALMIHVDNFSKLCLEQDGLMSFERDEVINNWKRKIEQAINGFFTKGERVITAYLGDDKFLVTMQSDDERKEIIRIRLKKSFDAIFGQLIHRPISAITVGFGNGYDGIKGIAETINEASLALKLGGKLGGKNKSYDFDEFGILYTFAEGNLEKKVAVANQTLSSLDRSKELGATLRSFFENNLNIADTAENLGIHRNTVIYRLKKITERLGLDPRVFHQAVMIKTALLIKKLA